MKTILILALAGAVGLACPAFAQGQTGGEPPQAAGEPAAAQAPAEEAQPRSPEEGIDDHRADFFARIQERAQAEDSTVDVERQQGIQYHPGW